MNEKIKNLMLFLMLYCQLWPCGIFQFRLGGGAEPLVTLLHSGKDEIRRNAAWAINMCALDPATATEMTKLGSVFS